MCLLHVVFHSTHKAEAQQNSLHSCAELGGNHRTSSAWTWQRFQNEQGREWKGAENVQQLYSKKTCYKDYNTKKACVCFRKLKREREKLENKKLLKWSFLLRKAGPFCWREIYKSFCTYIYIIYVYKYVVHQFVRPQAPREIVVMTSWATGFQSFSNLKSSVTHHLVTFSFPPTNTLPYLGRWNLRLMQKNGVPLVPLYFNLTILCLSHPKPSLVDGSLCFVRVI